jgi:hypothetical protein
MRQTCMIAGRMVLLILSTVLLLVQCGKNTDMTNGSGKTAVTDLSDLAQLKQVFNGGAGRVRLVALLSPV